MTADDLSSRRDWKQELRPGTSQEARNLGLTPAEFEEVCRRLGRAPNYVELGVFSAMWSEHCSYKTSKSFLKTLPTTGPQVAVGPGENAGAIHLDDTYVAVFKMESHNHPSAIEPFQGAATGVGGIMRDVFTMGARPVANADVLFFGDREKEPTPYLLNGVVNGISFYGNCMGVPTVTGQTTFDPAYAGNNLVNAMTVGIAEHKKLFFGTAAGTGNLIVAFGNSTGPDGVHGASMASQSFDSSREKSRPTVQVGDPFKEKVLLEATLELMASGAVVGIQDMGAAGLVSSTVEMAGRAGSGVRLKLDDLPVRMTGHILVTPFQRLLSESQERMVMCVEPQNLKTCLEILKKWDLLGAVIGEVTDTGLWEATFEGQIACSLPVDVVTSQAPPRAVTRSPWRTRTVEFPHETPLTPRSAFDELKQLWTDPNFTSRRRIFERYDHMVGLRTCAGPGAQTALIKFHEGEGPTDGIMSVTAGVKPHWCDLEPEYGSEWNVYAHVLKHRAAGAKALGLTDCLNFGSPEDPEVLESFKKCIDGLGNACRELGVAVVSGNVSLYNKTDKQNILPTPSLGVVGWASGQTCSSIVTNLPSKLYLVTTDSRPSLAGSLWAQKRKLRLALPRIDWTSQKALLISIEKLQQANMIQACRAVGEGGLLGSLWRMTVSDESFHEGLHSGIHFDSTFQSWLTLGSSEDTWAKAFGEINGGCVVSSTSSLESLETLLKGERRVRVQRIGDCNKDPEWKLGEATLPIGDGVRLYLKGLRDA